MRLIASVQELGEMRLIASVQDVRRDAINRVFTGVRSE